MKNSHTFPLINHQAIHSIVNRQENYAALLPEKNTESLTFEERLSSMNYFPELPVGGKCTRHRAFKIDLSLVGSTMNHVAHKYCNGIQAASDNKKVLLQDTRKQKLSELHLNEECIESRQREMTESVFNAKYFSMDGNFLSLESEILEEDELSYVSHVVEKTIHDMTLESEIECELPEINKGMLSQESVLFDMCSRELCLEKDSQLDSTKLNCQVTSSVDSHNVQLNYADVHMVLSGSHSITKETKRKDISFSYEFEAKDMPIMSKDLENFSEKLNRTSTCSLDQKEEINVPQKDVVRAIPGIHTPDRDKKFLANMDRKIEQSQEKKTKCHKLSSSPILQSNISPALKVLRKQRSESRIIAYDAYNPCNASIQQGTLQTCSPLASKSQKTIDSQIDFKEVENISERGFSIGNTSRSLTHLKIKCKKISKGRNKLNLTVANHQTLEKNEISTCIVPKVQKKELLNCKDWQCLQEAGSSWKSGVRRSLRIRLRPLNLTVANHHTLEKNEISTCIVPKVRKKELLNHKDWQCLQEAGSSCKSGVRRSSSVRSRPLNLTVANHQTLEKNEISTCIVPKVRKKEPLNCKDWHCVQEAGSSWKSGVRRSSRVRSRALNLTVANHQTLEKNEISTCIVPKVRKKELLNCKDWQCLQGAGSSWKSGVRRSSRVRSRPLEFWRGERFLYGRVLNCLSTVIGIKYTSPESITTGKDKTTKFKVESYVDDKYSDAVNFAALY
ncbi:uncharacterized protein LOC131045237 isoform X2 [Cryptomeria japonica]|uniref:uncharacterized protein LOC131045237 isoform X2 n=1 Tax=Cryptomeria japonica TaxID=3369 RepID=UPI0027DA3085|nr:uncharacterized protein LOC131045237 isoform X2 [Cryptomeria japonica]